jgi:hypothetical protein
MRILIALAFTGASVLQISSVQAQTLVCRASNAETANTIRYMKELVSATLPADSETVGIRMTYMIPSVSPTQVSLVTTERTCKSALTAYTAAVPGRSPAPTRVYVVAVGTVYVVWDNAQGSAEWNPHVILNSKFQVLAKFAG